MKTRKTKARQNALRRFTPDYADMESLAFSFLTQSVYIDALHRRSGVTKGNEEVLVLSKPS